MPEIPASSRLSPIDLTRDNSYECNMEDRVFHRLRLSVANAGQRVNTWRINLTDFDFTSDVSTLTISEQRKDAAFLAVGLLKPCQAAADVLAVNLPSDNGNT